MVKPLTLPSLSQTQVAELRQLYETAPDANLRLRAQMVLLAHQGRSVAEIATIVSRSRDTVERVLRRYLYGGVAALPRRKAPGMAPTVTPEWKAELLRVIELDPRTVGVPRANWTTRLLATYLAAKTNITVTAETVRLYLRAAGYVCKRSTWTRKCTAEEPPGDVETPAGRGDSGGGGVPSPTRNYARRRRFTPGRASRT
jgi:transposase